MAILTALPLRLSRRPARVLIAGLVCVFFFLTLTRRHPHPPAPPSVHYKANTKSFFPPLRKAGVDPNYCENFPVEQLKDIQVVLKTGAADGTKLKAHLETISSCVPNSNLLILSDHDQKLGDYKVTDILAELPDSYADDNDYATYMQNKKAHSAGEPVKYSQAGWRLDRFKFLPMVDKAYSENPKAKWYVFVESDVYFFWDTLFRQLDQYDPSEPHYLGSHKGPGTESRWYAYGGAGIVISQGLMKKIYTPKLDSTAASRPETRLAVRFEEAVKADRYGDAVLAHAIRNTTGHGLESLYPTFAGEDLTDFVVDRERWCVPLLSLHRLSPEQMESLWKWERTRPYNQKPFVYSSLLAYTHSHLKESPSREWWDNHSTAPVPNDRPAHKNAGSCGSECEKDANCLQWSYSQTVCRWENFIKLGNAVDSENGGQGVMSSGWDLKKMAQLGFKVDIESDINDTCEEATWVKASIR